MTASTRGTPSGRVRRSFSSNETSPRSAGAPIAAPRVTSYGGVCTTIVVESFSETERQPVAVARRRLQLRIHQRIDTSLGYWLTDSPCECRAQAGALGNEYRG